MSFESLAAIALILFAAYFIRGITGFGSGLIAVPLMAHFLPLPFVVPLALVLDLSASILLSHHARMHVRWDEIRWLVPPSVVGMIVGAFLLVSLPQAPLLLWLGLFVIFFGFRYLFNIHGDKRVHPVWAIPAGFSGGLIGAMFGTGGPPFVVYLAHRLRDKSQLRGTLSGLFLLDGALRLVLFLVAGLLLQPSMLTALLLGFPIMVLGLFAGHRIHVGISHRQQLAMVGAVLLLSGASLLHKAWELA